MQPYGLQQLLTGFEKMTRDIVLYLPRTSNLNQIANYVSEGEKVQATHYCIDGASKVIVLSQNLSKHLGLINFTLGYLCFLRQHGEN
jgi:hypothetical protein